MTRDEALALLKTEMEETFDNDLTVSPVGPLLDLLVGHGVLTDRRKLDRVKREANALGFVLVSIRDRTE